MGQEGCRFWRRVDSVARAFTSFHELHEGLRSTVKYRLQTGKNFFQ